MKNAHCRVLAYLKSRPPLTWVLSIIAFPLLNALLSLAARDRVPFFLDSIFTAVAAAVFGLPYGLATALLTNGWHEVFDGFPGFHLPFAICGFATALIVDAFVRSGRYRGTLAWSLCVGAVTLANSVLGALIAAFVFNGATRMNLDNIVAGFALFTDSVLAAAFLARLPINLVDKALAVAPALALAATLDKRGKPETETI